jgi:hypothetical protein
MIELEGVSWTAVGFTTTIAALDTGWRQAPVQNQKEGMIT